MTAQTRWLLAAALLLGASSVSCVWRARFLVFSSHGWFPWLLSAALMGMSALAMRAYLAGRATRAALMREYVFVAKENRLPRREAATYVGRGFRWTMEHARKLYELSATGEIETFKSRMAHLCRFGAGYYLQGLGAALEEDLFVDNSILGHHTLIVGTTGAGKTRLFELLIQQAIARGEATVVFDPKGDPDRRLLRRIIEECARRNRLGQLRIFDLTNPTRSSRYNPLGHFVYPKQLVSRIVASMPKEGESASFRDFAYKVVNAVVHAMHALNMKITLARIYDYAENAGELVRTFLREKYRADFPDVDRADVLRQLIPEYERRKASGVLVDPAPELDEIVKVAKHPSEHYSKMIANLFPLFSKLCTGPDRNLLSPQDPDEEQLTWETVDRQKLVVYFYLGTNADLDRATAVGRMALLDLQSYLGGKYAYMPSESYRPINIYVDELHAVLTEEYISIVNQARGAAFRITMGSQSFADLEHVLRSKAAARRVLGNANILFQLHVEEEEDAEIFASRCGRRLVSLTQKSVGYEPAFLKSGKHDVEDFRSTLTNSETLREVTLVPAWAIQDLPVGHYFARWSGIVYKGRFPFLPEPTVKEEELERISRGVFKAA
jgi:conjugal transfer pilus assembly protein TraD